MGYKIDHMNSVTKSRLIRCTKIMSTPNYDLDQIRSNKKFFRWITDNRFKYKVVLDLASKLGIGKRRDYTQICKDIIASKDWNRARITVDPHLYEHIRSMRYKDLDCMKIFNHLPKRVYLAELMNPICREIVETKSWDRARKSINIRLYQYIKNHIKDNIDCAIIYTNLCHRVSKIKYKLQLKDRKYRDCSQICKDIIKSKDWDKARASIDPSLYAHVRSMRFKDPICMEIFNHLPRRVNISDIMNPICKEIIETESWNRASRSVNKRLYHYIINHKSTNKYCELIFSHIKHKTKKLRI